MMLLITNGKLTGVENVFVSGKSSKGEGVAILIQPNCNVEIIDSVQIMEGSILALHVIIGGKQITLVNIYAL